MHNNFAALKLVQETGNRRGLGVVRSTLTLTLALTPTLTLTLTRRGLGVVMNNIALAATNPRMQDAFPQLEPREIYGAAISAARQQVTRTWRSP